MKELLELMESFQDRNNLSVTLNLQSDGSSSLSEFWEDDNIQYFDDIESLEKYLKETKYKLCPKDGRCLSPIQII